MYNNERIYCWLLLNSHENITHGNQNKMATETRTFIDDIDN